MGGPPDSPGWPLACSPTLAGGPTSDSSPALGSERLACSRIQVAPRSSPPPRGRAAEEDVMPADPRMRASDQDRDRTAALLREHQAVGRLDPAEFNERLDKVFQARTIGDLDDLTADLPAIDLYPLPTAAVSRSGGTGASLASSARSAGLEFGHGRLSPYWQAAWGSWLGVTLLCTVIWMLSGFGYPWPLWVAGPWGAILAGNWIVGGGTGGRGGRRRGKLGHHHDEISGSGDGG